MKRGVPLLLLLVILAAACSGDGEASAESSTTTSSPSTTTTTPPTTTTAAPTTTTSAAPEFPTGRYQAGTGEVVEFMADGTMTVKIGLDMIVRDGVYTVTGDEFVVGDDSDCSDFGDGSYIWSLDGERIVMEVVEDDCAPRMDAMTSGLSPVA